MFEKGKIFVHGVTHRDGAMLAMGAVYTLDHCLPCRFLRLPEIQHLNAIGIGHVIGDTELLHLIRLLADIVAGDPSASLAATEAAITEVQPTLDCSIVGLPPNLQPTTCIAAV
jgi:hypothetical protein